MRDRRPRLALFTHDAYGLGHVRRSVRILRAVAAKDPRATALLVTGSPATHLVQGLPSGMDYLKIPTIVTSGDAATRPPTLDIGVADLAALRGSIVRHALEHFEPDVLLVDNFPLGTRLELLPVLRSLRHRPTRTVLGLRDVVDPPDKVRADWGRDGLYEILDRYYDRIIVYGTRTILDAEEAYGLAPSVAAKITYCGYVTEESPAARPLAVDFPPSFRDGFVLATVGGGGDGLPLLETFVHALDRIPERQALVVAGEFMGAADRARLRALCVDHPRVVLRDHVEDLPAYMTAADLVVAMGGYNTSAEIVAAGARALLVPRTWKSGEHGTRASAKVDAEQLVRAVALERLGLVEVLHPRDLSPEALADRMRDILGRPRPARPADFPLDGAARVADVLLEAARDAR